MRILVIISAIVTGLLPLRAAEPTPNVSELVTAMQSAASNEQFKAITKAKLGYRTAIADTFKFADRVEIFLLDFSMEEDPAYKPKGEDETFLIRPYDKETKILKEFKVPSTDISRWCAAVSKTITSDKSGGAAACHFPIHGIRIYAGEQVLFETSICWECSNYYVGHEWIGLSRDARDLKALLDEFMPVPEKEKSRFVSWKKTGSY